MEMEELLGTYPPMSLPESNPPVIPEAIPTLRLLFKRAEKEPPGDFRFPWVITDDYFSEFHQRLIEEQLQARFGLDPPNHSAGTANDRCFLRPGINDGN